MKCTLSKMSCIMGIVFFFSILYSAETYTKPAALSQSRLLFIKQLAIDVNQQNHYLWNQRQRIVSLQQNFQRTQSLSNKEVKWLLGMAHAYRLDNFTLKKADNWHVLLQRVNILPTSLVIAQAINESNWGRSRFAKKAHNIFGIWCYHKGCGIIPSLRPKNKTYEVKSYKNYKACISDYFKNLNTAIYYTKLRAARAQLVINQQPLSGFELAQYMHHYSGIGYRYVEILQSLISRYNLEQYNTHLSQ